jgi:hypothetical protein
MSHCVESKQDGPVDFSGSSLWNASLTLMERSFFLTSDKRTKRSAYGVCVEGRNVLTLACGPMPL